MTDVPLTRLQLSKMIDHSLLNPTLTRQDTIRGLEAAMEEQVASATVKPATPHWPPRSSKAAASWSTP